MAFGFKAVGDSSNVQIDDVYPVFRVHAVGVTGRNGVFDFPSPVETTAWPLIFIRPRGATSWYLHHIYMRGSAGGWTGVVIATASWQWAQEASSEVSGAWDVAVVAWDSVASTERYGMRVFGSGGNLLYDSGHRTMRLLHQSNAWRYAYKHERDNGTFVLYRYDLPEGFSLAQPETYILANPFASGSTLRKTVDRDDNTSWRRYSVEFTGAKFTMIFRSTQINTYDKSSVGIVQQLVFGQLTP